MFPQRASQELMCLLCRTRVPEGLGLPLKFSVAIGCFIALSASYTAFLSWSLVVGCGFGKTWKLTKSSHHKNPWTNLVADSLNRGEEYCGLCEVSYRFLYCGGGVQLIRSWVFLFFLFLSLCICSFNSLNYYDDLFWNTVTFWGLSEVKLSISFNNLSKKWTNSLLKSHE